jgi:hypothetical protein
MLHNWLRPVTQTPARASKKGAKRPRRKQNASLQLEVLEHRIVPDIRSITGFGNNQIVGQQTWGESGTDLLRVSPVAYADGISSPSLANSPGVRVISDVVSNQADAAGNDIQTVNQSNLSDFGYAWGQFIDHDMDLTPTGSGEFFNIAPDPNDPSQMATQTFERSSFDPATGTSTSNPRQQVNAVTSFLDLSQVYGSTDAVADALRTHVGGQLKTSPGNLLPFDSTAINPLTNQPYFTQAQISALNMANDSQLLPESSLFAAGDVRANENVELTALQILFVRNHNRLAAELQNLHPTWTDEQLYQEARKLNIATEEMITYNAYLPDLLGRNAMPGYPGYQTNVDPAIATEFSTVAFRFGHSLLSNMIQRQDNNGNNIPDANPNGAPIDLAQDFFDPSVINPSGVFDPISGHTTSGIGPILKGDADGDAQAMDVLAINEVRNLLFGNGGLMDNGQDLIARDIQRARDDGIGNYNQVRQAYGLSAVTSFAQITSNVTVQHELRMAYGTTADGHDNVAAVDPFVGGMAEDHAAGSNLGPLFTRALVDQFTRLRNGDRFFYLNDSFTSEEVSLLNQAPTLARVIEANTNVTNLQADVFVFKASISGTVFLDSDADGGPQTTGEPGVAGVTVQLQDTSGDVLATSVTDSSGHYRFTQQSRSSANPEIGSGVSATGDYVIVPMLPPGSAQTTPTPSPVHISRGGMNVTGVDFGFTQAPAPNSGGGNGGADTSAVLTAGQAVSQGSSSPTGVGVPDGSAVAQPALAGQSSDLPATAGSSDQSQLPASDSSVVGGGALATADFTGQSDGDSLSSTAALDQVFAGL